MGRKIELDELELYLGILKNEIPGIDYMTSKEISQLINERFEVDSSERDVFLLHEPTIEEEIFDLKLQYKIHKGYE